MINVSFEEVKQAIEALINNSTYYNELRYKSMEEALQKLATEKCSNINEFTKLDQSIIDEQSKSHEGYLDGAEIGDYVWGDNEVWVSQLTVEGWLVSSSEKLNGENEEIDDIADFVENTLIVSALRKANK